MIQGAPQPRLLSQVGPGDLFGELSLLYNTPRAASVMAATPLSVYRLGREDFERLLESIPKLHDTLAALAAGYRGSARTSWRG